MSTKITPQEATQILTKAGIRAVGTISGIQLFIMKPNGRVIAVYNESLKTTIGGHLIDLNACGGILMPLGPREAFIEALIESLKPEEQDLVDLLVMS